MMVNELYKKAMDLPQKPGIYQMLASDGEILYVGKAKSLRNRVSSYFSGSHSDKTAIMVSKVQDFAVIVCASEFEALVLENSLIKEHAPRYNILLKDDKGYPYIRLDAKSAYPRFSVIAKQQDDGASYYGPYGKRALTREVIHAVCHAVQLPTCSRVFPRDIGRERPCLNHHMGQCKGFCLPNKSKADYDRALLEAIMLLQGKSADLIGTLRQEMEQAAAELRFELAGSLRDRIRALENLEIRQNVVSLSVADTDAIGFYRGAAKSAFAVLHYGNGRLLDKDYELIDNPLEDSAEAISAIVRQYYGRRERYPATIYLPLEIDDLEPLEEFLSQEAGHRVKITVPQRGEKRQLVEAAMENAKVEAERAASQEEKVRGILQWLQKALGLEAPPLRIEAFDISNLGADDIVAAMAVFVNGRPLKRDYRKFRIKSLTAPDDYHSMEEVLTRRFQRYLDGDSSFGELPDLVLIDGGATHAAVAAGVVERLGLAVPVFGMVKDAKHRTRALVTKDGSEIGMGAVPQVFAFIGTVQEETHRFAITYQRSLRMGNYGSALDDIPGVGKKRRDDLLRHFKTVKRIREATMEELREVVPKNTAEAIFGYFAEDGKGEDTTLPETEEGDEETCE
ncbi:MAG: excinuclease ABC subunit UvrC [Oscillospiraceae bacterium]|nr:excinuclease ABC subunit UvrC [Oscillospiraceae bacterium]